MAAETCREINIDQKLLTAICKRQQQDDISTIQANFHGVATTDFSAGDQRTKSLRP
jgi:hypothetical protein